MELSQKELQRVKVIENAVAGRLTVRQAGDLLGLSQRQVKRLKQKYEPGDVDWVKHGNVGSKKPWGLSQAVAERIVKLAREVYVGFNDSHLTEKLVEAEKIAVSRETVRRLLRGAGMGSPQKRRARKYRSRRERKFGWPAGRPTCGEDLMVSPCWCRTCSGRTRMAGICLCSAASAQIESRYCGGTAPACVCMPNGLSADGLCGR